MNSHKVNSKLENILKVKPYEFSKIYKIIQEIVYKYDMESAKIIIEEFMIKGKTNIGYLDIIRNIAKDANKANKKEITSYIIKITLEIIINNKGNDGWYFSIYLLNHLISNINFTEKQIEEVSKLFYKNLNTKKRYYMAHISISSIQN